MNVTVEEERKFVPLIVSVCGVATTSSEEGVRVVIDGTGNPVGGVSDVPVAKMILWEPLGSTVV